MIDEHYLNPKLASIYDYDSPWSRDRDFYVELAGAVGPEVRPYADATRPQEILDLGCGTGLLCNAYAERGHSVTGVDPSAAMLEIAGRKPFGEQIRWVLSFAQAFSSDQTYDLIIMTGHAFQAVLEDHDIDGTFAVMKKHLKPNGVVVFESRNPNIDWSKNWHYEMELETPHGRVRESRKLLSWDRDRMLFELGYEFPDEHLRTRSELRFLCRAAIESRLERHGLRVANVWGDWNKSPFDESTSEEMIFQIKHADSC